MKLSGQIEGFLILLFAACLATMAQQPFVTDDADVTEKGKFNLEIGNETDSLQPSALPVDYQDTFHATVSYGLLKNLEVSLTGQFLALASRSAPRFSGGIGDASLGVKYNFRKERDGSMLPALTASAFVEFPTGSARRGFGSGTTDFGFNFIAQKTVRRKNVFRLNAGAVFAGNLINGALGFASVRGQIFTGGASFVRPVGAKLQLGAELVGAAESSFKLSRGQLQAQFGGNYQIDKKTTFDFGIIMGRFAASPRLGVLVGFSRDF